MEKRDAGSSDRIARVNGWLKRHDRNNGESVRKEVGNRNGQTSPSSLERAARRLPGNQPPLAFFLSLNRGVSNWKE